MHLFFNLGFAVIVSVRGTLHQMQGNLQLENGFPEQPCPSLLPPRLVTGNIRFFSGI
jgi:hypothetical protein